MKKYRLMLPAFNFFFFQLNKYFYLFILFNMQYFKNKNIYKICYEFFHLKIRLNVTYG